MKRRILTMENDTGKRDTSFSVLVNDRYVYNSATHTTSKGSFTPTSAFGRYQFVAGTWETRWKQMHQHPRIHPKSKHLSRDSSINKKDRESFFTERLKLYENI